MTRRILWALYWTAVLGAACAVAAIPFTGLAASAVVVLAAGICLIGIACAPHPGGAR